ncbi:MAG: NAD-dependent epimerase/dehydratase family protein [Candidatus Nitrotoga sp.]|nr:NAD-dependent epimerase/dehydratase family protein [Candidatus Nitrotoga sp.]
MTIAWVIGSSGLLGSALCRALRRHGTELFSPTERLCWGSEHELSPQLAAAVQSFAAKVGTADRWEIYWAAGVGTMSSPASALVPETNALSVLLSFIESQPQLITARGALTLASSAGAIYAGYTDKIISENTPPAPTTAYAHEKLRQEDLLRSFVLASSRMSALIARISTLYGPGHSVGKQQGLIAHIARCILRNQPIQIYVPFDTIRDYITADDAAAAIVASLRAISERPGVFTKIIASEQPTTIAEIVSIFKRIARRVPRIVTSASRLSGLYSRRVQFRSIALPERERTPIKSLVVGISQLMAVERSAFVRGQGR